MMKEKKRGEGGGGARSLSRFNQREGRKKNERDRESWRFWGYCFSSSEKVLE
jgi:hypothetical protein